MLFRGGARAKSYHQIGSTLTLNHARSYPDGRENYVHKYVCSIQKLAGTPFPLDGVFTPEEQKWPPHFLDPVTPANQWLILTRQ